MEERRWGLEGCFNYLIKTRNEKNSDNKEVVAKRQRAEIALNSNFNDQGPEIRQLTIDVFNERRNTFEDSFNEHFMDEDGKAYLSVECLNELERIANLIGLKISK